MTNAVYVMTTTKAADEIELSGAVAKFEGRVSEGDFVGQGVHHGAPQREDEGNRALVFVLTPDGFERFTTGFPGIDPFRIWPRDVPLPLIGDPPMIGLPTASR